jgi:uncharacterized protein (TIGR03435 family)
LGQGFEVASIKASPVGPAGFRGGCHGIDSVYAPVQAASAPPLGRCIVTDARLSHLVYLAWEMHSMNYIKSGPEWIAGGDERFNVDAKAEDPRKTTERQLLEMLQALLVERFQLKYHREPAEQSGFALTVAKNGPKFQEAKRAGAEFDFGPNGKPGRGQPRTIRGRALTMPKLVDLLTTLGEHGPGVDKTGLAGVYDFTLNWDEDAGPTLDVALREQLGLRMEAQKVPVSYFVIDSARRPSAN